MSEWKDIGSAPKDKLILLGHEKLTTITLAGWNKYYQKWQVPSDCEGGDIYEENFFTHWMPLPEAPQPHNTAEGE